MAKERNVNRYRLSVPDADVLVNQWVEKQDNLSFSLRCVIKDVIRRYGITDVTCSDFTSDTGSIQKEAVAPVVAESVAKQDADAKTEPQAEPAPVEPQKTEAQPTNMSAGMSDTLASMLQ